MNLISSLLESVSSREAASSRPKARTQLQVEMLEDRLVPAAAFVSSGVLVVQGDATSERIYVSDGYSNNYTVSVNERQIASVSKSSVWQNTVRIFGNAGGDYITMASWLSLRMEVHGGSGNDRIWGGNKNDTLRGNDGIDKIYGQAGDDWIDGGAGSDEMLSGGSGIDTILGGTGNDTLYGDSGKDYLYGGFGTDIYVDFDGVDSVYDPGGTDWLYKKNRWVKV